MDARLSRSLRLAALAAFALGFALACEARDATPGATTDAAPPSATGGPAAAASGEGATEVVAEVKGDPVTQAELDAWIREDLFRRETGGKAAAELYEFRMDALDRMLDEQLVEAEASARGVTVEELFAQEARPEGEVSDAEVQAFYEQNKARMGSATLEQIGPRIRAFLADQQAGQARQQYLQALREKAGVVVKLEAPRVDVAAEGPALGPEDAPITIVEFSDYQCPFCRRAEESVKAVLDAYPDQVRFVYRHFPLDQIHPRARPAAEAAMCADAQGKFWEYHAKLFSDSKFEETDLMAYADAVGLDKAQFEKCVKERKFQEKVEADLAAGRAAGVSGTPAFFVNGIMLSGAKPPQEFVAVIERELAAKGKGGAGS